MYTVEQTRSLKREYPYYKQLLETRTTCRVGAPGWRVFVLYVRSTQLLLLEDAV